MIRLQTQIRIERPIEDVFAYVADPGNFPHWNSAVQAVRRTSDHNDEVGTTYRIERSLPRGTALNELEIVTRNRPDEFTIRTTSGPTPFAYRFRFSPDGNATVVDVDAETELGSGADLLAPLVRRAVRNGVDDNLATLREILERSRDRR